MTELKGKIKNFLSRFFKNYDLNDDEDFFESGLVNSLFAMQLVMFLEKEFSMEISNEDIDISNFRSINSIYELVKKKSA